MCFAVALLPPAAWWCCEFTPTVYSVESSAECGEYNYLKDEELKTKLVEAIARLPSQQTYNSCLTLHNAVPSTPSGYYNIITSNNSTVQVYCDMEGTNCGGDGGWTRVAYVNLKQLDATCPQGLEEKNFTNVHLCGVSVDKGCNGTFFSPQVRYSKICGWVRGYQYSLSSSFLPFNNDNSLTIDNVYVNGVSITYGNSPHRHIWTYAGGPGEQASDTGTSSCPCKQSSTAAVPSYVGTDYYCEVGVEDSNTATLTVYTNDPLWDGQQCGGGEAPCCTHPNMPWFIKTLSETTTEDIELRLCKFNSITGYTPVEQIELFVQYELINA